jgi:hypothetical protein
MSVWQAPPKTRPERPPHPFSALEIAIFAAGVLVAMMVGIASSGLLPV